MTPASLYDEVRWDDLEAYARQCILDVQLAEDALQDTAMKLCKMASGAIPSPQAYARTCVHNFICEHFRGVQPVPLGDADATLPADGRPEEATIRHENEEFAKEVLDRIF